MRGVAGSAFAWSSTTGQVRTSGRGPTAAFDATAQDQTSRQARLLITTPPFRVAARNDVRS